MVLWNGVIVSQGEFRGQELLLAEGGIKSIAPLGMAEIAAVMEATHEAHYAFKAKLGDAPERFNCLTFMTWTMKRLGLEVASLLEVATCGEEISLQDILPGDLVFAHGIKGWYCDPNYGPIGHVGIATLGGVMHATRRNGGEVQGVVEESLESFLEHTGPLRTIRRLVARSPFMTLSCSAEAWRRAPPRNIQEVKEYIDRSRAWFQAQLVDA